MGKRISSKEVKDLQGWVKHEDWHEGLEYEQIKHIKSLPYVKHYWPKGKSYVIRGIFNEIYMITKKAWEESK